jgi:hypothetical protein
MVAVAAIAVSPAVLSDAVDTRCSSGSGTYRHCFLRDRHTGGRLCQVSPLWPFVPQGAGSQQSSVTQLQPLPAFVIT